MLSLDFVCLDDFILGIFLQPCDEFGSVPDELGIGLVVCVPEAECCRVALLQIHLSERVVLVLVRIGDEKIVGRKVVYVVFEMYFDTPPVRAPEGRPWEIVQVQADFRGINSEKVLPELLPPAPVKRSEDFVEQALVNLARAVYNKLRKWTKNSKNNEFVVA